MDSLIPGSRGEFIIAGRVIEQVVFRSINFNEQTSKPISMKRLYRSKTRRVLGGVCGGIGDYLDIDPTVIRLVWAVLTIITWGIWLLAYIVAWILVPEEEVPAKDALNPEP